MAQQINWDAFSTSDLQAISEGRWDDVSTPALTVLSGEEFGTGETLARGFERGVTSTFRGLSQLFGNDLDFYNNAYGLKTDLDREQEFRAMTETNPWAAYGSYVVGSVADPSNLIPLGAAKTVKQFVAQGAAVGAATGALEPTYEGQFDDSRLLNTVAGTAVGGVFGGLIGKLVQRFGANKADEIVANGKVSEDGKTITTDTMTIKIDEAGEIQVADNLAELEDIRRRIQIGEPVTPAEQFLLREGEGGLAPLTPEEMRIFDIQQRVNEGKLVTQSELRILQDYNKQKLEAKERVIPTNFATDLDTQGVTTAAVNAATSPRFADFDPTLAGAKPGFGNFVPVFESDLDKALFIINGNSKSSAHERYTQFVQKALGITSPSEINRLSASVKKELGDAIKQAQKLGKTDLTFSTSKTVDRLLNPVQKNLDNISKEVYNLWDGKSLDSSGFPSLGSVGTDKAMTLMKTIDPTFAGNKFDAYRNTVAYRKYLDGMKNIKGSSFRPPSFEQFIKKGIDADDQLKMVEAGFFDGCF